MRLAGVASTLLGLSILLLAPAAAGAKCDPTVDPDKSDIANARAAVAANCDCALTPSHGAYVSCASQQIDATLVNRSCRGHVKRCASSSNCGKPLYAPCCRVKNGQSKCSLMRATRCDQKGGTRDSCTSCCDACPAPGSGSSCPTTTSSVTTTTSSVTGGIKCCLRTVTCGPFSNCQIMTGQECGAAGGFPQGPGDCSAPGACAGATTTTPPSACCLPGQCVMTGACECGQAGGVFKFFQFCGAPQDPCATTTTTIP